MFLVVTIFYIIPIIYLYFNVLFVNFLFIQAKTSCNSNKVNKKEITLDFSV